jgi:hypothetical protein
MKREAIFLGVLMLGEVLTWIGVAVAGLVAWGLYAFGADAPRRRVRAEEQAQDEQA